jgi:arsenate reductase-like glutaredoxin family protein
LLLQQGIEVVERDYFKEPFSEVELRELAGLAAVGQIFARRSPSLKQMGLAGQELSDDEMVNLMLQEPKLVRRPLLRIGDTLLVGGSAAVMEEAVRAAGTS